MRIGSLFSGAGGLDLAVEEVFGATTAWHCENNPAASKVLVHRWPGVPNHHDITTTDWSRVEPVDIICGGWPCQPFSMAGKRLGADDERALWPHVERAVRLVRPRYVVLENVSAVLGPEFQRVANSLAALGYDLAWTCLRASDVGTPHRRERVFVLAYPADQFSAPITPSDDTATLDAARFGTGNRDCPRDSAARVQQLGRSARRESHAVADSACDGRHEGWPEPTRQLGGSDAPLSGNGPIELLPTPRSSRGASTTETTYILGGTRSDTNRPQGEVLLPTPAASDGTGGGQHPDRREGHTRQLCDYVLLCTPSASDGEGGKTSRSGSHIDEPLLGGQAREMATQWGKYEPAIRRWEQVVGPAPSPTEPNSKGNPRLSAAFSQWLMGWPDGWVTDVPGITRNDALRIIGNGVVPQCAATAIAHLLTIKAAA